MKEYNKKKINGVLILLNWTKLSQKDYDLKHANISNNLYTVKKIIFNNFIFVLQVYIGNLDPLVEEEELFNFLKNKYKSIKSCKIIYDSYNNISKGFGFADFSDIDEYNSILKNEEKLIFKENELIIK